MKPGRELDALIAEKVMKLVKTEYGSITNLGDTPIYTGPPGKKIEPIKHYSTDISAAWEVVEKMRENLDTKNIMPDHCVRIDVQKDGFVTVTIAFDDCLDCMHLTSKETVESTAKTAPHAICLAALKAIDFTK